jgi:anti-sigma B factor antagonist
MNENASEIKRKRSIKLEGNLSIYDAGAVKENLRNSLLDIEVLEINLTEIRECDTTGLQILCSAKKTADKEGKRILLDAISKPVEDTMIKTGIIHEMISHDGGAGCQR